MYYVLPESMRKWVYKVSSDEDRSSGCIGHVRGYFDSSDTFSTTGFPMPMRIAKRLRSVLS